MKGALAIAAVTFTDRTCFAATGLTWRQFKPFALERGIPIARAGRRPIVRVDHFLAAVDASSGTTPRRSALAWDEDAAVEAAARRSR